MKNDKKAFKPATRSEWMAARKKLLALEKKFDRERDKLTEARRKMPLMEVEEEYSFDGPRGVVTLRDLFEGRPQLIVYHFMFEPSRNTGCKHCSCVMDNIAGSLVHLRARDTSFAAISRAPLKKIQAFKTRMGWTFHWVSSFKSSFNYDFQVTLDPREGFSEHNFRKMDFQGELPGLSVFVVKENRIFRSYSTYLRGLDMLLPMYHLLDRTPLGRQETKANSMAAGEASWIRYHDAYDAENAGHCCAE
jgi:predicted dithiol-disulfide oxidoreductase (DUF899 family)